MDRNGSLNETIKDIYLCKNNKVNPYGENVAFTTYNESKTSYLDHLYLPKKTETAR